ncbi:MAG: hypothetical protein ACHP9W_06770 [Steroidobacterales bacterium]
MLKLYRYTREPGTAMQAIANALRPRDLPALVGDWPFADDLEAVAAAVVPFLRSQMAAG